MRRLVLVMTASMAIGACGKAGAVAPDYTNPAHCLAAFNYAAFWLSHKESYRPKVAAELAKGIYEMNKIKSRGQSVDRAKAESERVTKAYAEDSEAMDELYIGCTDALKEDAEFKTQFPALLELAKPMAPNYR